MKGVDEKVGEEVGEEDNANNYLAWNHSAFPLLSEDILDKEGAAKAADTTARAGLHDQARMNHDRNPHGDSQVERGSHVYVVYVWAGKDGELAAKLAPNNEQLVQLTRGAWELVGKFVSLLSVRDAVGGEKRYSATKKRAMRSFCRRLLERDVEHSKFPGGIVSSK